MALTVKQVIDRAHAKILVKKDGVDLTSTQYSDSIVELNAMMAGYYAGGIRLGHTVHSAETETLSTPEHADEFIISQLAMRLTAEYGKAPSQSLIEQARLSFKTIVRRHGQKGDYPQSDIMPLGSGYGDDGNLYAESDDHRAVINSSGRYERNSRGQVIKSEEEVQ